MMKCQSHILYGVINNYLLYSVFEGMIMVALDIFTSLFKIGHQFKQIQVRVKAQVNRNLLFNLSHVVVQYKRHYVRHNQI